MRPAIILNFTEAVKTDDIYQYIHLKEGDIKVTGIQLNVQAEGKTVQLVLVNDLKSFTSYTLSISGNLPTKSGGKILNPLNITLNTGFDNTDKFPRITDEELLTLVQKQTFKYFWDFGHPISGLARERNTSGNLVTSGGSGF